MSFRRTSGIICGVNAIPPMPTAPAKPLVYLETSFISYLTARVSSDPKLALDQAATRRWWEEESAKYLLCISDIVIDEAGKGDALQVAARKEIIADLEVLPVSPEAERLANRLIAVHAIPAQYKADAFHVGIAAVSGAKFLLTWNCRHIANHEILPLTMETVTLAGYRCPWIETPAQFLESSHV